MIITDTTTTTADQVAGQHALRVHTRAALVPGTATQVRIDARDHQFVVDEPAELGGDDAGANPVEHLLAALGSCQVITYQVWAQKLGLALDNVEIDLAGDIDLRGFFGLDPDVRAGFQTITATIRITGPEEQARYDELIATVEKHCPVGDTLVAGVPVHVAVDVAAS